MPAYFCLLTVLAWLACGACMQAQHLEIAQPLKSVGALPAGESAEWILLLRNTGTVPMGLHVVPDCGVSVVQLAPNPLPPGQRARIVLRVHTTGRRGAFTRTVHIYGSDGEPPVVGQFQFAVGPGLTSGTAYRDTVGGVAFQTLRETIYGGLDENSSRLRSVTFRVQNISNRPIHWLDQLMAEQPFALSAEPNPLPPGAEGKVVLTYRPGALAYLDTDQGREQPFVLPIRLYTSEARQEVKTLHIAGTYTPRTLTLPKPPVIAPTQRAGSLRAGASAILTFPLANPGKTPLRISAIRPTAGVVLLDGDTLLAPGAVGSLRFRLEGAGQRGPVHRTVTLYGNFGQQVLHLYAAWPGKPTAAQFSQTHTRRTQ